MSDETTCILGGCVLGVIIGCVLGIAIGLALNNGDWRQSAIEHNAAHYDAKTGEFTWNQERGKQ